ncbi:TlpA family protein disulfide reductase [bacterium]|nr:MAG: TlpA family protein disulfide reductase [bacterium]
MCKKIIFYILLQAILMSSDIVNSDEFIPDVRLKDINKKKIQLTDISKDNYVLFNFWNMACEPCKKEMKFLNEFHKKYSDYNFKVISINMDSPRSMSKVKKYVKSSKYVFDVLQDPRMDLFKKMGGSIMPFVVIADNEGRIINKHIGYNLGDEKSLEEEIKALISFKIDSNDNE